jgi:hypothetical protein
MHLTALLLVLAATASAQTVTATLTGSVLDPTGAAVVNASLTLTHKATNTLRTASTNDRGDYTVPNLSPGLYSVAAEHPGFKRALVDSLELLVNQTARLDFTLEVGSVSESVEVAAGAPLVNSETASVGQVIDTHQMDSLPLKGRGFFELALLAPGTTPRMPGSFVGNRRPFPGGLNAPAFHVGGAREKSNGYIIDGVDAQDPHYLTPSIFPSVDAIQEFKLETNAYSAEFGRFAAQVNATTRSGSNQFHGSAYHFLRNDALDAANFFDNFAGRPKAPLRYNQFGVTQGGRIFRNRTFFFASYEGTRIRRSRTAQLSIPSAEQRNGDFSRAGFRNNRPIFDPATTTGTTRQPFAGNRIPASRLTDFAKALLPLYPLPSSDTATGNNYFATLSDLSDNNQILTRLDHRLGDKNTFFFRYSLFDGLETAKSPIDFGGSSNDVRTQNMAFNYVRAFRPDTLYELRLGYNRPSYLILQDGAFEKDYATQLGLRNLLRDPIGWGVPNVSLSGFSGMGTDTNPTTQLSNVYQMVQLASFIRGPHSLKAGADLRKTNYNDRSERFVRGSFSFTGGLTANPQSPNNTGVSVADLLLGLPLTAGGSNTSLAGNFNGFTYSFFAQDDWKLSRRATLNLGLRYELNTRYSDVQNRLTFFDTTYPGGRILIAGASAPRGLIPTDRNNFAPRLGLAIRPTASNRTAIRLGYGLFYDMIELQDLRTWVRNPPFGAVIELRSDQNANSSSPSVLRVAELFPPTGTPAARPNVFSPTADYPETYYQQWNLSIQHALPRDILVEAGYLGSKGTRLAYRFNANQAALDADPSRPTPILNRRPFPNWGNTIRITDNSANSTYHALLLKAEKRLSQRYQFLASYTFAKSLDGGSLIDDQPRDINNRRLNKARSGFDLRHRASLSGAWELPRGFQANTILRFRSGFPYSVGVSGDVCNCAAASQLAQLVGDSRSGFTRSRERWFNTAAFAIPARGTLGSSGRNILDGPGAAEVDFSLFKNFLFAERYQLQLRAESFNLFNRVNFGQPASTVGTPTYGIIQSAADPRIVQFSAKLKW